MVKDWPVSQPLSNYIKHCQCIRDKSSQQIWTIIWSEKPRNQTENLGKNPTQSQNIHCKIQDKSDQPRQMHCRHAESVRIFPESQIKILQTDRWQIFEYHIMMLTFMLTCKQEIWLQILFSKKVYYHGLNKNKSLP